MSEQPPIVSYQEPPPSRMSGLAVTSFVLGCVSIPLDIVLCTGSIVGGLGIILGAVALSQMKDGRRLRGRGLAICGIILGIISILLAAACGYSLRRSPW